MEKRKNKIIVISCLAIITLIGATFAAFRGSSQTKENVSTSALGITLLRNGEDIESNTAYNQGEYKGLPGETVNEKISVKAKKGEGYNPVYVRVTAYRYWTKEGTKVSQTENGETLNVEEIVINTPNKEQDWIFEEDPEDPEVVYMYYKKQLEPGGNKDKADFMESYTILGESTDSNKYLKHQAVIEFEANAVQTTLAKEAMLAEWGVEAVFDGTGNLISAEHQK
ncbi:MAG TPA: hypothetical protein H9887_04370 [Candidatus Dorea intestinavium]|nr:hypothetical protein [Candidatus Dorea intestinavium]